MSTTVTFFEELRIRKDSPKGAELVRKLSEYILQYNGMKDLEDLTVTYLELACGDERATVEEQTDVEPGNIWVVTQDGFERKSEEHIVWTQDSPPIRLAGNLNPAREIVFRLSGSMTRPYTANYTYRYWLSALEGLSPEDGVEYRCAEAADADERVVAYHLNGIRTEEVPRDGSSELVADIPCWYGELFSIRVSIEDEERFGVFEEKIGGAMQALIDDLEDEYLEPDIYEGGAELSGSLELEEEQIPGFLNSLQAIADAAKEMNAEFECAGELLPTERTNNGIEPFAVLKFTAEDGQVAMTACRY